MWSVLACAIVLGSFVSSANPVCPKAPKWDVHFIVDCSNSATAGDGTVEKATGKLMKSVVENLCHSWPDDDSPNGCPMGGVVSVAQYSTGGGMLGDFNLETGSVADALWWFEGFQCGKKVDGELGRKGGVSNANIGFDRMKEYMSQKDGLGRSIIIFISDGMWYSFERTMESASFVFSNGIVLRSVGVGTGKCINRERICDIQHLPKEPRHHNSTTELQLPSPPLTAEHCDDMIVGVDIAKIHHISAGIVAELLMLSGVPDECIDIPLPTTPPGCLPYSEVCATFCEGGTPAEAAKCLGLCLKHSAEYYPECSCSINTDCCGCFGWCVGKKEPCTDDDVTRCKAECDNECVFPSSTTTVGPAGTTDPVTTTTKAPPGTCPPYGDVCTSYCDVNKPDKVEKCKVRCLRNIEHFPECNCSINTDCCGCFGWCVGKKEPFTDEDITQCKIECDSECEFPSTTKT